MGIIEDLEGAIDIVELVGRYTKLKKAGANYKSLCPFPGHNEKTPSFVVSPSKQIGYCFGCHKGGGALKFVMDIENCSFKEAITILGNITGIQTNTNFDPEKFEAKKNMFSLYKDATNYYKQALKNYPQVKKYLYERGLSEEIISQFSLGYADSGVELYSYLQKKGYDEQQIADSHIFLDTRSKKDKFIGRIIFPIQNNRGDFVAFAGRIIKSGEPKYLNSPASNIYDKSNILYNLFSARQAITKEDFVIITEGYMDVIALSRGGIMNAVAVSGTALTEKHTKLIKRLTKKVFLCFDGDKAGEKATKHALEVMKNNDIEVRIISIPNGKDPDDIISSGKDFREYIEKAVTPIGFYLKKTKFDPESLDDKKRVLAELLEVVKSYASDIERDFYLKEICDLLDLREHIVYDAYNKVRFTRGKITEKPTVQKRSEDLVFAYLLTSAQFVEELKKDEFLPEMYARDLQIFLETGTTSALPLDKKEFLKGLALELELQNEEKNPEAVLADFKKALRGYEKELFEKKIGALKQAMKNDDSAILEYTKLLGAAKKRGLK